MKVFKFGGASIKSAQAIRNIGDIIRPYAEHPLVIIVSAMGKSTNALENILTLKEDSKSISAALSEFKAYHWDITGELFQKKDTAPYEDMEEILLNLERTLDRDRTDPDQYYSEIIAHGELLSSTIVSAYLNGIGMKTHWADARDYIVTDNRHCEGKVDWEWTRSLISEKIRPLFHDGIVLTQGFIARGYDGMTTTLGREGSDYSAAIFASCLNAESLTIWKDVPGILNADPKVMPEASLLDEIPYKIAAEMTYYGAKVIHPKTIKPLALAGIPLQVKSFDNPTAAGTCIRECQVNQPVPSFIFKENQCLISFKVTDYSFIDERNLSIIFSTLAEENIKINLMQNSAISFSVCTDYNARKLSNLTSQLKGQFEIYYNTGLQLITILNYDKNSYLRFSNLPNKLVEQVSRSNYRVLISK